MWRSKCYYIYFYPAGPERKSAFIEQKNREVVAYHEGGHALVAHFTPGLCQYSNGFSFR